jgi:glycine/D-amino acid oxidase-like deaminating enzyme
VKIFGIEIRNGYGSSGSGPGMDDVQVWYASGFGGHSITISWYAANDLQHRLVAVGDSLDMAMSEARRGLVRVGHRVFGEERAA